MTGFRELFTYFFYFRKKVGNGLLLLIFLFFVSSYLNGLGISLLLPILNLESSGAPSEYTLRIREFFSFFGAEPSLKSLLILFGATFLLKGLFQFFQDWYRFSLTTQFTVNLQRDLAESYSRLNFEYYGKTKSGFFTNIFTRESGNVVSGLHAFILTVGAFLNSVVLFIFACSMNLEVTIQALVAGGVVLAISTTLRNKVTFLSRGIAKINGSLAHLFIQFIVGFKYLKSIEGHFRYLDRVDEELNRSKRLHFTHAFLKAATNGIYEPVTVIFLCAIIYVQVVIDGQSIMAIAIPLLLLNRFLSSFFAFQRAWHDFCGSIGSIGAFEDAMKVMDDNREDCRGRAVDKFSSGIEVKNLNFEYGDRKILKDVSLTIPKNKCIAIVGDSGAGKTTLLNILTGLLPVEKGEVFFDGAAYSEIDKLQLRAQFGYVTQEAVLFDSTIANNITLWKNPGKAPAEDTRLMESARSAHCLDFISKIPDEFNGMVGDRGTAVSGGQRQRLVIAREIYRNPEIFVFDEATSSLDSESEGYIQETIRSFLGSKTMIIVAHRISSLKICDYIYVLKEGRVVEQGTWDELLAEGKNTYFARIHGAQQV